jgi:hypothetical protein
VAAAVYQDVFGRMVASPAYREWVVNHPDEALDGLDLTDRERRRLLAVASQPGMAVNTAIHRANRLTPIDQALPLTCALLGDALPGLLERYWMLHTAESLQVPSESERFRAFLGAETAAGRVNGPYLEEVLDFERACAEQRLFVEQAPARDAEAPGLPLRIRIVRFAHDPVPLLGALASRRSPPSDLPVGEFYVVVDGRSAELEFRLLDRAAVAWFREHGLI